MKNKTFLLLFATVLICLGIFFLKWKGLFATQKNSLEVSVVIPGNDNEKRLLLYESSDQITFHVLVKNVSDQEVRIWKDWNSWGFHNLSFQIQTNRESLRIYKTKDREWNKNFPDYWSIKPNEFVILNVNFDVKTWPKPREWNRSNPKNDPVKIKCFYEVKESFESRKYNVWTGSIESPFVAVWIYPDF